MSQPFIHHSARSRPSSADDQGYRLALTSTALFLPKPRDWVLQRVNMPHPTPRAGFLCGGPVYQLSALGILVVCEVALSEDRQGPPANR